MYIGYKIKMGVPMFNRAVCRELEQWRKRTDRKPLILRGARQVGKTSAVNIFSESFDQYIYLNLENKDELDLFGHDLPVDELFQAILLTKNIEANDGSILLFIDEIQNSPAAIAILRYFFEHLPRVHVIAAGSLLETFISDSHISFPVGRVEFQFMHPLTFEEFLEATGEKAALNAYSTTPVPRFSVAKLFDLFHTYTLLGGMPEVIAHYITNRAITSLNSTYQNLLLSYIDDAGKYAKNSTLNKVLKHVIQTAPFEASKRIKLGGFGNSNYKAREVGEAVKALESAMLVKRLYPSVSLELPIIPDFKKHPKLQFLDTGLVNYFVGLQQHYLLKEDLHGFYKGLMAEHIVAQELLAAQTNQLQKLCFWVRESARSNAEVDFLIQHRTELIPIEVKSGAVGSLKSLHLFIDETACKRAVRLSASGLKVERCITPNGKGFTLINLPYFLTAKITDYLDLYVDNR